MKKLFLTLAFFLATSISSNAQVVGRNLCKIFLTSYDSKEDDGNLSFEIDCRMVDCLLELEISNDERRKKKVFQYPINENNYYINEEGLIVMRMDLGSMESLMDNYQSLLMSVTIYSMSSYPVFRRLMPFDRPLLIRTYQANKHE